MTKEKESQKAGTIEATIPTNDSPSIETSTTQSPPPLPPSDVANRCILFLRIFVFLLLGSLVVLLVGLYEDDAFSGAATVGDFSSVKMAATKQRRPARNESHGNETMGPMRILYVVTSSSLKNRPRKGMDHHGSDRWKEIILPVILEAIESMHDSGYVVDLYLILSYELGAQEKIIRDRLPPTVGLEVWNDAIPLDYDEGYEDKIRPISRALSRQHRFVVRDKLFYYDFFMCFEDDMRITSEHIRNHLRMSKMIDQWKAQAPDELPNAFDGVTRGETFFGKLTKEQLKRVWPGFIRVEVLWDEEQHPSQSKLDPIPLDFNFSDYGYNDSMHIDPTVCCHTSYVGVDTKHKVNPKPKPDQVMVWETSASGISFREMPDGKLYALMAGPRRVGSRPYIEKLSATSMTSLGGRSQLDPRLLAQSAGWMMTRKQIVELHTDVCAASFLPPFDPPFLKDGLYRHNVEFWSGGIQMWCARDGCNLQRILSLDPIDFSKQLLYHTANNKQKSIGRPRLLKVDNLLGQINALRKVAEKKKAEVKKL